MPNRSTTLFRDTISEILSGNSHKLQEWLDATANGKDAELHPLTGDVVRKAIPPDPARALDLLAKLAEYAAPKLGRIEHVGDPTSPMQHHITAESLKGLSEQQMRALASIKLPDDPA